MSGPISPKPEQPGAKGCIPIPVACLGLLLIALAIALLLSVSWS